MAITITKVDGKDDERTSNGLKQYFKAVLDGGSTGGSTTSTWGPVPIVKVTQTASAANSTVLWNTSSHVITFTGFTANGTFYFSVDGNEELY